MKTIEPAHIRSTDQAEHVLAVRQINLVFRQSKNLK